ncbi:MAG: hypothetical protein LBD24_03905 [Spirochaetaceae bacterium]|jgi:hypothetical protein|nr:hypothetical protein [Spirochaetaceae bacterium]
MNIYGPLRASLFIYEIFRLILMAVAAWTPLEDPSGTETAMNGLFPYAVYAVPNALFPLMTYFLLIRLSLYKTYLPLYIAGKIIGAASIIGWAVFSLHAVAPIVIRALQEPALLASFELSTAERSLILLSGVMLVIAGMDALSVLAGVALHGKLNGPPEDGP